MTRLLILALVFIAASAVAAPPVQPPQFSAQAIAAFEQELRGLATADIAIRRDSESFVFAIHEVVVVPNSPEPAHGHRSANFTLDITPIAYLSDAAQRALREKAAHAERVAFRKVKSLQCEGKEFSDQYQDGLYFRPRTDAQCREVEAYRRAHEALAEVPQYHKGTAFAVKLQLHDGEPPDGTCGGPCVDLRKRIEALLTAYPE